MDKNKIVYFLMLIIFMVFVIILNVVFFIRYSNTKGNVEITKKYYKITYISDNDNVFVDDDKVIINLSNENMTTSFNMYNIGNEKATIDSYIIDNFSSNLSKDKVSIKVSIDKDDTINGGENISNKVEVICNNCSFKENDYVKFNLKYFFKWYYLKKYNFLI